MTRKEAINTIRNKLPFDATSLNPTLLVMALETLGLIKFEPERDVKILYHNVQHKDYGDILIEVWPEGLVLWVGGVIKWKSWEKYLTPREIYNNHMAANFSEKEKIVTMCGLSFTEVMEAIEFYHREKIK
jgi:hypothetical protein